MSDHLTADSRGIILPCASCGTANRIVYGRLDQHGRCGTCQQSLPRIADPVQITESACLTALMSQSPLPIVVDFWAQWCGPCRMMAPEFAKAASQAPGEAIFVKINTEELPEIANPVPHQGHPGFHTTSPWETHRTNIGIPASGPVIRMDEKGLAMQS